MFHMLHILASYLTCLLKGRLFQVSLMVAFVLTFGFHIATPQEIANYLAGNLFGCWELVATCLIGAVFIGLACGYVEETSWQDLLQALLALPWFSHVQRQISVIAEWLLALSTTIVITAFTHTIGVIAPRDACAGHPLFTSAWSPLLISPCWPTGMPHILYEPVYRRRDVERR